MKKMKYKSIIILKSVWYGIGKDGWHKDSLELKVRTCSCLHQVKLIFFNCGDLHTKTRTRGALKYTRAMLHSLTEDG